MAATGLSNWAVAVSDDPSRDLNGTSTETGPTVAPRSVGRDRPGPRLVGVPDACLLAGGALALILSFLHFYDYRPTPAARAQCAPGSDGGFLYDIAFCRPDGSIDNHVSAWHGLLSASGPLLLLASDLVVLGSLTTRNHRLRRWLVRVALCASLGAVVVLVVAAVDIPRWPSWPSLAPYTAERTVIPASLYRKFIIDRVGLGWYLELGLAVGMTALLVRRVRTRRVR